MRRRLVTPAVLALLLVSTPVLGRGPALYGGGFPLDALVAMALPLIVLAVLGAVGYRVAKRVLRHMDRMETLVEEIHPTVHERPSS